ncbi:hypothetical protein CDD81_5772 [Ophiocordyceps australis]|uniref:Uncharacterized protein n=1 Tax=Ophiocordyceps australis TaxID=1399860 RepID=A0A2C5Y9D5_9HYPO|nr:hypothetical protein CDD81_5772 [Ophiocordyceps australis]
MPHSRNILNEPNATDPDLLLPRDTRLVVATAEFITHDLSHMLAPYQVNLAYRGQVGRRLAYYGIHEALGELASGVRDAVGRLKTELLIGEPTAPPRRQWTAQAGPSLLLDDVWEQFPLLRGWTGTDRMRMEAANRAVRWMEMRTGRHLLRDYLLSVRIEE